MPTFTGRIFRLYQRKRIINIHVNVVVAGLLAIALAMLPVHLISQWLGPGQTTLIPMIAYVLDTFFDAVAYFGLHWMANHWKATSPKNEADRKHQSAPKPKFLRDVFKVQAERLALVPVFALVSMGSMWLLMHNAHWPEVWAFTVAFIGAIITTRLLHTLLGMYTGTFVDHAKRNKAKSNEPNPAEDKQDS